MLKLEENSRGTIGDMFGTVNALFSGLAFAGIILTIYMQREELALQRKELEETRQVFEKQSDIMSNQQSDAQFFSLLENHRQMVKSLEKQKNRYNRGSKSVHLYNKEPESGYQFINDIANEWKMYLSDYSEMYKTGILFNCKVITSCPVNLLSSEENIRSYVSETTHLADFVQRKFGDTDSFRFYNDTLAKSLLESEKFVLSAWHDIIGENSCSPYGMEIYSHYEFIDFNNFKLPQVEIQFLDESREQKYLSVESNGTIEKYYTIIEHRTDDNSKGKTDIHPKSIMAKEGNVNLSMLQYLADSILEVESFPAPEIILNGLSSRYYSLVFEVLFEEKLYYLPLSFNIREKQDWKTNPRECESLYFLNFDWNNRQSMSQESASELIEWIHNYKS